MGTDKASNRDLTDDKLNQLILSEYPYPIAVNYKRLLDEQDWEKKTRICIQVFEYGVRAITLGLISQYLIRDVEKVSDPQLNQLLLSRLSRATLGTWNEMFFKALQAYQGKRNLFFMPELYDLYWDTSISPHRPHKGVRAPFDQLVQIRNDLTHGVPPRDEAGWQAKFQQAFHLLRQVLGHFTFLENYDLIRIRWAEAKKYWYDIYTGLQVISPSQPFRTKENLTEGWFYLSKQEEKFLELHPLLIFWEKELVEAERERMRDAAIFDHFQRTSLSYLATVLGERFNLTDRTLIAEFIHTVYYTIEKVKMARREAKKLTWWLLKEVAEKVSSERIGDVRSKYRREVYLQREEARGTFEEFLASDKTCLVLIGKSGVGKSNFFLSLMDEYADSSEVCTLMYNGARFSAETGVADALARDFELYLKLEGLAETEGMIGNILFEINRIEGIIEGKKVVLLIDALNENPDAKGLLRRVDALVEANPCPWLKVMISSRPETWRTIKRGVRLAEHKYYREEETGELGVEMQPFNIEVEMKPFAKEELPAAYAKYQEVFGLQTDYEEIPAEVRQMLRDPLTLWLVAEIYRGQEIPQDIKVSELYQEYVNVLIRTERLYPEDIRFLERELVPLMIREGEYANSIMGETISAVKTTDGKSLFELIHSDEVLSNGRRVNQSYANLVDTEILMELGTDVDYEIAFKYERFYEYYGGRRLYELSKTKADLVEAYDRLVGEIRPHPFLWGAIKTALFLELENGQYQLVMELSQTEDIAIKDMLVATLVEFGGANPEPVRGILDQLLELMQQAESVWQTVRGLVSREPPELDLRTRMAKRVAIEVACDLGMEDILERAACDPSPSVRAVATQYTYYLWRENPEKGFRVLENLAGKIRGKLGLPRLGILESCVGISAMIVFDNWGDPSIMEPIQNYWRKIIEEVFFVSPDFQARRPGLRVRLRRWVVRSGARLLIRQFERIEQEQRGPFSIPAVALFFELNRKEKQVFERLIQFIDPSRDDWDQIKEYLIEASSTRDVVTWFIVEPILLIWAAKAPNETLRLVEEIVARELAKAIPGPVVPMSFECLIVIVQAQGSVGDSLMDFLRNAIKEYIDRHRCRYETSFGRLVRSGLWIYIAASYRKYGQVEQDLLEYYVNQALKEGDREAIEDFVMMLSVPLLLDTRIPVPASALIPALRPLLHQPNQKFRELAITTLAWMRQYYPNDVEDFLEEEGLGDELKRSVRVQSAETLGNLITGLATKFAIEALLMSPNGLLRRQLRWILEKALHCQDIKEWGVLWVEAIVNLMYGEMIFETGQPALR